MTGRRLLRGASASLATLGLFMQPPPAVAGSGGAVEIGPASGAEVQHYASKPGAVPALGHAEKLALLRQHVKYMFVLFQENRSFDQYFGTFPGADGLFGKPAAATPGFVQKIVGTDGAVATISPFLIPQTVTDARGRTVPLYPADTDSADHSQRGIGNAIDLDAGGVARNDRYALNAEGLTLADGSVVSLATKQAAAVHPTLLQKQRAELVMAHLDCDTVPFLWRYADRFTLFDNFHMTIVGPSTPNAIAIIAGQAGDTQWVLHPEQASTNAASPDVARSGGVPVVTDPGPLAGSDFGRKPGTPPYGPNGMSPATPALNQTYATLPLSFMGPDIDRLIAADEDPAADLPDVQDDIKAISGRTAQRIDWGWYQQGYDHEPTDGSGAASHADYVTHHNAPQYFGYVGNNPDVASSLHGLGDFFADLAAARLPEHGGVFYVRGGYGNLDHLLPLDPNPTVRKKFPGNDDHPGYSDAQISEALLADAVNAIAASPYWKDSAIVITYDESDGQYDHAPFHPRSRGPAGAPLDGGPRIPAIMLSPYAVAHGVSHEYSEHSSVIRFIDELFGLVPLGKLPDEMRARALGKSRLGQDNLGPADALPEMGDLFTAFDDARLSGKAEMLPASYATIPAAEITALPHPGCAALGIVPTDYVGGKLIDPPPPDFNPRPGTTPGTPTSGDWVP